MDIITEEGSLPIKSWCPDIEDEALAQAKNLAKLPFAFHHVALMPDSHKGYGMPIGGVLATKDVIIPNAVGVDIGCVDGETEVLTPSGWVRIDNWEGQSIMQFDPNTDTAQFVTPSEYIVRQSSGFIHFKTKYGIDQMLSKDHRVLLYRYDRSYSFSAWDVMTALSVLEDHTRLKLGSRHKMLTAPRTIVTGSSLSLSNEMIRVIVMCCADGHVHRRGGKIVVRFKKQRKIERARDILSAAGIEITHEHIGNGVTSLTFSAPLKGKSLSQLWGASQEQLQVVAEEVLHWDGNANDQCFFSCDKDSADLVHYAFMASSCRSVMRADQRPGRRIDYRVFRIQNRLVGLAGTPKTEFHTVPSPNGYEYCFKVPSSFFIIRRGGNIVITGNCGMCAQKLPLREVDQGRLKKAMSTIRETIPVGFNHHKTKQLPTIVQIHSESKICQQEREASLYQLGTLGGGNHFIEIQKGSDGFIWIMIHSGSRNLGYKVAEYYDSLATKLNEQFYSQVLKKWELAFLPIDSKEGKDYIEEMNYCVEFALANRKLMMERAYLAMAEACKDMWVSGMLHEEMINIAHNYAAIEHHYGKDVWVHRKGATLAREGTIGIIPGSQGSKSYIVRGLGSKESFESCSHGAGRKMGRKEAQRSLNLEDEIKRLDDQGIIHGIRNKNDLDEAAGAYKDIDIVMENQKDLVEKVVELTPLAVVKG